MKTAERSTTLSRLSAALGFALGAGWAGTPGAFAQGLNVEDWLRRPGVKLVAVEFYATWCKPCMEAVPKWKALHDKYRRDGLRLIVVSTRDAGGVCQNPGWTPDEVVCDDDGFIADRFGANQLPAAFLWGWQGHLLARNAHVEEVEARIEDWMRGAPRVDVQADSVPRGAGISADGLREAVRADLQRYDKLVVVATEAERAALRELVRRSHSAGIDESYACEIGKEMSANSLLRAVITSSGRPRLQLKLLSAERGCLVAAGATLWNPDKPSTSIGEAVADLLNKLRLPKVQLPWTKRAPDPEAGPRFGGVAVTSDPPGLEIVIDGRPTGLRTPAVVERVPSGPHDVQLLLDGERIGLRKTMVEGGKTTRVPVNLPGLVSVLRVNASEGGTPLVAEVLVDGSRAGMTPLVLRRVPGEVEVEVRGTHGRKKRQVRLEPGRELELQLDFSPEPVAPPPVPVAIPSVSPKPSAPVPEAAPPRPEVSVEASRGGGFDGTPLGWAGIGLGAASGVASGVLFLIAEGHRSDAEDADSVEDLEEAVEAGDSMRTAGWVLAGTAGGLAALGILFHLLDSDGPSPSVALTPDGSGAWVGARARW